MELLAERATLLVIDSQHCIGRACGGPFGLCGIGLLFNGVSGGLRFGIARPFLFGLFGEKFERRFAIDGIFIHAGDERIADQLLPLFGRDRPDMPDRRYDERPVDDRRHALFVKRRNKHLADAKLGYGLFSIDFRIFAERGRCRLYALLFLRRICPKCVLDAVAELCKDLFRNVRRILRNKINSDAFRSDKAHDLFDLIDQRRRSVGKQQVSFVKKEHKLRLVKIAGLGQRLKKLGQQPQQETSNKALANLSS